MRIAILGGTFDPIHNGHLAIAETIAASFEVDEVHFVPAFCPPHKPARELTSPFHRFAMVALATQAVPKFRSSTIEVDALEKRYSVDTLDVMHRTYPGAQLLLVMGADMYQELESWRDFRRLFDLAHLAVVNRPGFPIRQDVRPVGIVKPGERIQLPEKTNVFYLPAVEQPISSRTIRSDRKSGGEIRHLLPPPVWSYIDKNGLYT